MPFNKRNLCNNEGMMCVLVTQFSLHKKINSCSKSCVQYDLERAKKAPKKALCLFLFVAYFLFFFLDNFWSYTYFFICGWAVKCVAKHHFKKKKVFSLRIFLSFPFASSFLSFLLVLACDVTSSCDARLFPRAHT